MNENDTVVIVDVESKDEIKEMKGSFNDFIDLIKDLMKKYNNIALFNSFLDLKYRSIGFDILNKLPPNSKNINRIVNLNENINFSISTDKVMEMFNEHFKSTFSDYDNMSMFFTVGRIPFPLFFVDVGGNIILFRHELEILLRKVDDKSLINLYETFEKMIKSIQDTIVNEVSNYKNNKSCEEYLFFEAINNIKSNINGSSFVKVEDIYNLIKKSISGLIDSDKNKMLIMKNLNSIYRESMFKLRNEAEHWKSIGFKNGIKNSASIISAFLNAGYIFENASILSKKVNITPNIIFFDTSFYDISKMRRKTKINLTKLYINLDYIQCEKLKLFAEGYHPNVNSGGKQVCVGYELENQIIDLLKSDKIDGEKLKMWLLSVEAALNIPNMNSSFFHLYKNSSNYKKLPKVDMQDSIVKTNSSNSVRTKELKLVSV